MTLSLKRAGQAPGDVTAEQMDLAADIATTENFDRLELQRFVTLWWVGHIAGSAAGLRACLAYEVSDRHGEAAARDSVEITAI